MHLRTVYNNNDLAHIIAYVSSSQNVQGKGEQALVLQYDHEFITSESQECVQF